MKISTLLFILLFTAGAGVINQAKAQAASKDSLALVDLYNSTNGPQWSIHTNWLTGAVSTWYGVSLSGQRVRGIYLYNNNLSGIIPVSIGDLDSLKEINLSANHLHGTIPSALGNLSSLVSLDWSGNQLSGNLPLTVVKLRNILHFDVSYNRLTDHNNDIFYLPNAPSFYFNLKNNRFTFNGLESIAKSFPGCFYTAQQKILIHQHHDTLAVSAGGTLGNNTYKWSQYGKSGAITIYADSFFIPSENGTYYVKVTNKIADKLTLNSYTFSYNKPQAKNAVLAKTDSQPVALSIYPDPVKEALNISGLNLKTTNRISITDIRGISQVNYLITGQSTFSYNVSRLKPGNYVLSVIDATGTRKLTFIKE